MLAPHTCQIGQPLQDDLQRGLTSTPIFEVLIFDNSGRRSETTASFPFSATVMPLVIIIVVVIVVPRTALPPGVLRGKPASTRVRSAPLVTTRLSVSSGHRDREREGKCEATRTAPAARISQAETSTQNVPKHAASCGASQDLTEDSFQIQLVVEDDVRMIVAGLAEPVPRSFHL